jgi:hypothetical protein
MGNSLKREGTKKTLMACFFIFRYGYYAQGI